MAKMIDKAAKNDLTPEEDEVLDTIFTIPNLISTIRLCMVPCFIVLLLTGYDILATVLFAVAAGTDWIDGQIARRTHTVSKLGRLLDPAVDRILMISGVVCLLAVGRLPLWVVVLVLAAICCSLSEGRICSRSGAFALRLSILARWRQRFCSSDLQRSFLTGRSLPAWGLCPFVASRLFLGPLFVGHLVCLRGTSRRRFHDDLLCCRRGFQAFCR